MRCPGQDMRYWADNAAFEVACPKCAASVEFFKDESSRRCQRCQHVFPNPKLDLGCAQWCEYATQCLGVTQEGQGGARDAAFASKILTAAEEFLETVRTSESPVLLVFQHTRELVSEEVCNPRVVLAAALVLELESHAYGVPPDAATPRPNPTCSHASTQDLLAKLGLDKTVSCQVCDVLQRFRQETPSDDADASVLRDAVSLADLAIANSQGHLEDARNKFAKTLKTNAAKARAQRLFGC